MSFNKVTAIVRCARLETVERRLQTLGVKGMTVTHVKGFGEYANFFREDWSVKHARLEMFVDSSDTDAIVSAILATAHTGTEGDGIIAVLPVERLYRIRERRQLAELSAVDPAQAERLLGQDEVSR
jgi:nitrogen regulatory protein P-II 1